ncbi:TPM domain-containing protein [Janibacter melonis]|uniref:TPM domain-containing protein n=1 Tax=Janibacter melonis TaxID=262209 RepID=UPI00191B51F7|nr:TPM domain-containing protein [Janibacter melonis]
MSRSVRALQVLLAALLPLLVLAPAAAAERLPVPPAPSSATRFADPDDVLTSGQRSRLARSLRETARSEPQVVVRALVVRTTGDEGVEAYARRVGTSWRAGVGRGVLVVVATQDRRIRVQVGSRERARLTDREAARIIGRVRPALRDGRWETAVARAVELAAAEAGSPAQRTGTGAESDWVEHDEMLGGPWDLGDDGVATGQDLFGVPFAFVGGLVVVLGLVAVVTGGRGGSSRRYRSSAGIAVGMSHHHHHHGGHMGGGVDSGGGFGGGGGGGGDGGSSGSF